MFHVGHLHALQEARTVCSELTVAVVDDDDAELRFGHRPFVPVVERMAVLASLDCVDAVVAATGAGRAAGPDLAAAWRELAFDVLFTGADRNAPFRTDLPPELAATVRVIDLPRVGGTASALLRSVLSAAGRTSAA